MKALGIRKPIFAVVLAGVLVMVAIAQAGDTGKLEGAVLKDPGELVLTLSPREDDDGKLVGVVVRDGKRRVLYDGPAERWEPGQCVLVRRSDGLAVLVSPDVAVTYRDGGVR